MLETKSLIFSLPVFIFPCFLLFLSHHGDGAQIVSTSIGVIIDARSPYLKQVKAAMKVAAQIYNSSSSRHSLSLHFKDTGDNPLQASQAAKELIQEKQVKAIICMEEWPETVLVAEIGQQARVPILSLAASAIAPLQRPFMVQMADNFTEQMRCIAAITGFFQWKRVIAIYETDRFGSDSGMLAILSEHLQRANSAEIDHRVIIPPFSSLHDPERFIQDELAKLMTVNSRVFIILQSSLPLARLVFKEAKQMGLMSKDSAWIVTDIVASLLDYLDTPMISSMEGVLGIKTFFSDNERSYLSFKQQFKQTFHSDYPMEDNSNPGIHALRAFDSITVISKSLEKLGVRGITSSSSLFLSEMLSSNYTGLSGIISFRGGELKHSPPFTIVNVVGKSYKEVGFWLSKVGFSNTLNVEQRGETNSNSNGDNVGSMETLTNLVTWLGNLKRPPKGWVMPTIANRMKIVVPSRIAVDKFVKVESMNNSNKRIYSGFCIDVFQEVLKLVEQKYPFPYEFYPYNESTYDDLIDLIINKNYDAIIGDVTILANRSKYVEFTQPYIESSLTMVVTEKLEAEKAWMFLKPFTIGMWVATGAILTYTIFVVWLLERQSNPEFEGPWKRQLGTAFWFTCSSLFFAQREKVHNSYTRVVVVAWLFVVLVLNSSYTANLSSMLTVKRLQPNVTSLDWLKSHDAMIGYDSNSFVNKYLADVLGFKPHNIKSIDVQEQYLDEFRSGNISAAFLELPFERAFLQRHCIGYTGIVLPDRFGGFGFVFQKGSPIAADFSEAILNLSETGVLKRLEAKWFSPSSECLTHEDSSQTGSLSWKSFGGLFLFTGFTSTFCFLLSLVHGWFAQHSHEPLTGGSTATNRNLLTNLARFFLKKKVRALEGNSGRQLETSMHQITCNK